MTAYFDRPSPVHALDPRVKIAWSVVVSLLAVVLGHPLLLGGLFALTIVPWCLVRPPLARLRLLLVLVGTTVLGTMISQGFFYGFEPRTELLTLLPGLSLCREGVVYGAIVSSPAAFGAVGRCPGGVHHVPFGPDLGDDQTACASLICLHADPGSAFPAGDCRTRKTHPGGPAIARGRRQGLVVGRSPVSASRGPTAGRCRFAVPAR